MNRLNTVSLIFVISIMLLAGCSSPGNLVEPSDDVRYSATSASHGLWGLYEFRYDPGVKTLDVTSLRTGAFHLNALPFLEPPPLLNLTLEGLEFDPGDPNHLTALIGLRHPFLGLTEFTGFDVCGILIGNGTASFGDSGLSFAAENETHLLNPDGYSRLWNPDEFPANGTIFGYQDGLLGAPDSYAGYDAQINGYKFYCSEFGFDNYDEPMTSLDTESRHEFNAGDKVIRTYDIQFGDSGWIFNYAIDANWTFPEGDPPWDIEDFATSANRPEAWLVTTVETENSLWNYDNASGGNLSLSVRVSDHLNPELNEVTISSPGNLTSVTSVTPDLYGATWADYTLEFLDQEPGQSGTIPLYIEVACEEVGYGGMLPGEPITAYFIVDTTVSGEPQNNPDPPTNFWLEVLRSDKPGEYQSIDGLKLHWDAATGAVEYAVYYDDNPYGGVTPATYLDATSSLQLDYDMATSDLNESFVFVVRARGISGNPASESNDSEQAFVEFEGFETGTSNPGQWGIGNESSVATFLFNLTYSNFLNSGQYYCGNYEPGGVSNAYHVNQSWTILYSPQLPDINDSETVIFELVQKQRQVNTDSGIQMGTMAITPSANAGTSTYTGFDGTNDYISGVAYNQSYEYAIQSKFGTPTDHWQYHTESPFMFSAYDCFTGYTGGHEYVGIGYATTSNNDIIAAAFDDIAIIIY